jgi:hypothetical protein
MVYRLWRESHPRKDIIFFPPTNIDIAPLKIKSIWITIETKKLIKVLGVVFDSKLNWYDQNTYVINCANRALNAINMIIKFFTAKELTSLYYQILTDFILRFWNLAPSLLVASAAALWVCPYYPDNFILYGYLHIITKRATLW